MRKADDQTLYTPSLTAATISQCGLIGIRLRGTKAVPAAGGPETGTKTRLAQLSAFVLTRIHTSPFVQSLHQTSNRSDTIRQRLLRRDDFATWANLQSCLTPNS